MAGRALPPAARLWRWAGRRAAGGAVAAPDPEVHLDTAAFVDAVHMSSKILRWFVPAARGVARLRHFARGTQMPPEVENIEMLENWNSSDEFLLGAEEAHRALLLALWRPPASPLPAALRDATSPGVRGWLDEARQRGSPAGPPPGSPAAPAAPDGGAAAAEGPGAAPGGAAPVRVVRVAARFERVAGPESLELIRTMELGSLWGLRSDERRLSAFQRDAMSDAELRIQVASAAEAALPGAVAVRRVDRLHLACGFNLREGISSAFKLVEVEELLREEKEGGFHDDDEHSE